jgi:hypothetical protein
VTQIKDNHTQQGAKERAPRRAAPAPAYWLFTKRVNGRMEVLTLHCEKTLPVFSHQEEAQMFFRFSRDVVEEEGWRVTESGAGELVSMLYGLCGEVEEVALDPLPEMVAERTVGLVSLNRGCFIERITTTRRRALRHREEPGRGSSSPLQEESGRSRRSEVERIATPYPAGRLAYEQVRVVSG